MTDYVVLFPADDEQEWRVGSEADHQRTYDTDAEFVQELKAIGGAVSDGPYAETVEQISGFYLVTCDSYDALVDAARVLTRAHPVVEIRPVEDD
jgi:hypothetical protein